MSHLAIITGATSGIGAGFARELAKSHSHLWLIGRRREELDALATSIHANEHCECVVMEVNLDDRAALQSLADKIAQEPHMQTLVNNAGYASDGLFHEMPWADHDALSTVHIQATMQLTHAALPVMVKNGHGAIYNVASIASWLPTPHSPLYGPTKAYIRHFTNSLIPVYRPMGINMISVCPGFTRTDFPSRMGVNIQKFYKEKGLMRATTVEEVVRTAMEDMAAEKIVSIAGLNYRFIARLLRTLPDRLLLWITARDKRFQRPPQ